MIEDWVWYLVLVFAIWFIVEDLKAYHREEQAKRDNDQENSNY